MTSGRKLPEGVASTAWGFSGFGGFRVQGFRVLGLRDLGFRGFGFSV